MTESSRACIKERETSDTGGSGCFVMPDYTTGPRGGGPSVPAERALKRRDGNSCISSHILVRESRSRLLPGVNGVSEGVKTIALLIAMGFGKLIGNFPRRVVL